MPKMETESLTLSIGLDQIVDTGNIRELGKYDPNRKGEYPEDIIKLAESIKSIGQLQPVVLKEIGIVDGSPRYELIAGFRRRAAFQYLKKSGNDYNRINATIVTGDKLIIQLVENIQREDLTAKEREAGIFKLLENGLKQTEIAAQLSKSKSYISIHVSAYKMRRIAEDVGINTSIIETTTFGELLSVPEDKLAAVIQDLVNSGGTRAAANQLAMAFKKQPSEPTTAPAPVGIDPLVGQDTAPEPAPHPESPKEKPEAARGGKNAPEEKKPVQKKEEFEADHRIIDVNIILKLVLDYIEKATGERKEAAENIFALIHKALDSDYD